MARHQLLRRARDQIHRSRGCGQGRSPGRGPSIGRVPRLGPNTYRLALFRFAQDAFSLFDMALLAAALHGFRFRFCVVVG